MKEQGDSGTVGSHLTDIVQKTYYRSRNSFLCADLSLVTSSAHEQGIFIKDEMVCTRVLRGV